MARNLCAIVEDHVPPAPQTLRVEYLSFVNELGFCDFVIFEVA